MSDIEKKIREWCRRIARAVRWQKTPFDASEIDDLEEEFNKIALASVPYNSESRQKGLIWVCGALEFLHGNINGPNNIDPRSWFFYSLEALIDIASPQNDISTEEGAYFIRKLREGLIEMEAQ